MKEPSEALLRTEKLKLPHYEMHQKRLIVDNASHGYYMLLKEWWDYFDLNGKGLVVGEEGEHGENVKKILRGLYPFIEVFSASLKDADIIWDITQPLDSEVHYDWIICQAVLEHVKDPVSAVKNMANALNIGGYLYIHTHGPNMRYHPYPIDCYRFFRDALIAFAELAHLEIADILWTPTNCFAVYRRI